jgi:hypothetical protein
VDFAIPPCKKKAIYKEIVFYHRMIPNKGAAIEMAVVGELNITDPPNNTHVQKF